LSPASFAGTILFDFGNGAVSPDTGVAANVVIGEAVPLSVESETVDGVTITLEGVGGEPDSQWGSNSNGIGIITAGQTEGAAARRRIDATRGTGEFVNFSFDFDVTIDSITLGNMNIDEVVEIALVSGNDPFAGGSFTFTGPDPPPQEIDDIPVNVFVKAGTVLSLSASVPKQNGVLWNDIAVTVIPEPATLAMLSVAMAITIALRRVS
jgi:hypothetical protein